jgi:hypothetical protein
MIRPEDLDNLSEKTIRLLRVHGEIDHLPIGPDELRSMDSSEIADRLKNRELDHLLGRAEVEEAEAEAGTSEPPAPAPGIDQGGRGKQTYKVGREALRGLSNEEIVRMHRAGELDGLMRGER